jgi:hypothetical protein
VANDWWRFFAEWNEQQPGFAEVDLVAHDGGLVLGDFCQTLDLTDVCTGWTETEAVPNKAQVWVFEAIRTIRERLRWCPIFIFLCATSVFCSESTENARRLKLGHYQSKPQVAWKFESR